MPIASTTAQNGVVYLVGAGPGSLELLTLQAYALISTASCLLHDDLVSDTVLSAASSSALVRNVGKRCGKKTVTQEQINQWMVAYARTGHSVVRLQSGDPLLFGRASEEIAALVEAQVPFVIVPGVSAGFAAAAAAAIPLTGRISTSRILFATRHLAAEETSGLKGISPDATLVLYMPGRDYRAIQAELFANGWSPLSRCVLASALGQASQQIASCSLGDLASESELEPPVVMLCFPERRADPV